MTLISTARGRAAALALASVLSSLAGHAAAADARPDPQQIERGRYMVQTGHCNNCHTAGYANSEGSIPEERWLMGSGAQGWRGPWGTTYAANLRTNVAALTEDQWVLYIKALRSRPPMPFWSTAATTPEDLRAMYQFIKQLGPVGEPAPAFLPPGQDPKPPFIQYPMPPK
jgi:mono/diheme cytochrome c family protein